MPTGMACPFFHPTEPVAGSPARPMPLGDVYDGECRAQPDGYRPTAEQLWTLCNLGYARHVCPRFPDTDGPDAVRFSLTEETPGTLRIHLVREKDHRLWDSSDLEYDKTSGLASNRLAEAYAESHLRRKQRRHSVLRKGKTSHRTLAEDIARRYSEESSGPFPLADLTKLKSIDQFNWSRLHGELDLYFSAIAGYASRVLRIEKLSTEKLAVAEEHLSQCFFEKHPDLAHYRSAIDPVSMPDLVRRIQVFNSLRADLLALVEEVIGERRAN